MARIRTIKPDFFKNEQLSDLPAITRLLFIGLWTQADKEGRLHDRPKRIKAEIFPYDNVNIENELSRLQSAGFIERYEVGEMKVIQIDKFTKHQRISGTESFTQSELPAPPKALPQQNKAEGSTLEILGSTLEALKNTGKEGKGKEGNGDGDKAPPLPNQFGAVVLKNIEDLKTDCLNDQVNFVEHVYRQTKIPDGSLPQYMENFNAHLRSIDETMKSVKDYRLHAQGWIKKQPEISSATQKQTVKIKVK